MDLKDLSSKNVSMKKMTAEQKMIAVGVVFIIAAITVFVLSSTGLRSRLQTMAGKNVPEVSVYYSADKIHLPSAINVAINDLSYHEPEVKQAIAKLDELDKGKKLEDPERAGAQALKKMLSSFDKVPNFDGASTSHFRYKVVNVGKVKAESLEISLPGNGYIEIRKKRMDTVSGPTAGKVTYDYLLPGEDMTIDFWTSADRVRADQVTGKYKGGYVLVKPMSALTATVGPDGKKQH